MGNWAKLIRSIDLWVFLIQGYLFTVKETAIGLSYYFGWTTRGCMRVNGCYVAKTREIEFEYCEVYY